MFGACCYEEMTDEITHVIAGKDGTKKVKDAKRLSKNVVHISWLLDCCSDWVRYSEQDYAFSKNPKLANKHSHVNYFI